MAGIKFNTATKESEIKGPESFKVKSPPLRIYIRTRAKTVYKAQTVDHNEQIPEMISLTSLKEKFGLTQQKSR